MKITTVFWNSLQLPVSIGDITSIIHKQKLKISINSSITLKLFNTLIMDLLETILRNAKAEEFIENFRDYEIEASTLPLLSNEDLEIIGVCDQETRLNILSVAKNLKIPKE